MKQIYRFLFLLFIAGSCASEHSSHHEIKKFISLHNQNIWMGESLKSFEKNNNVMFVQPDFDKEFNKYYQDYYGDLNMIDGGSFECTFIQDQLENFTYSLKLAPLDTNTLAEYLKTLSKHYSLLNHQANVDTLVKNKLLMFTDYRYTEKMRLVTKKDKTYLIYTLYSSIYKSASDTIKK